MQITQQNKISLQELLIVHKAIFLVALTARWILLVIMPFALTSIFPDDSELHLLPAGNILPVSIIIGERALGINIFVVVVVVTFYTLPTKTVPRIALQNSHYAGPQPRSVRKTSGSRTMRKIVTGCAVGCRSVGSASLRRVPRPSAHVAAASPAALRPAPGQVHHRIINIFFHHGDASCNGALRMRPQGGGVDSPDGYT